MAMAAALGAGATSLQHMAQQVGTSVHRYLENAPVPGLADATRVPLTHEEPRHTNNGSDRTGNYVKHAGNTKEHM
eukprot:2218855-Amphidinium_carterae.1